MEWAIDQLKPQAPELQQFACEIVEGANAELHELPISGTKYGLDLNAKRIEHKGTNEGCNDIQGWWQDSLKAYHNGNKEQAYFLLGVMLHMIEDMGVPAHANKVYHQGNLTEFDNFEFMALSNWKPSFADINRSDQGLQSLGDTMRLARTGHTPMHPTIKTPIHSPKPGPLPVHPSEPC